MSEPESVASSQEGTMQARDPESRPQDGLPHTPDDGDLSRKIRSLPIELRRRISEYLPVGGDVFGSWKIAAHVGPGAFHVLQLQLCVQVAVKVAKPKAGVHTLGVASFTSFLPDSNRSGLVRRLCMLVGNDYQFRRSQVKTDRVVAIFTAALPRLNREALGRLCTELCRTDCTFLLVGASEIVARLDMGQRQAIFKSGVASATRDKAYTSRNYQLLLLLRCIESWSAAHKQKLIAMIEGAAWYARHSQVSPISQNTPRQIEAWLGCTLSTLETDDMRHLLKALAPNPHVRAALGALASFKTHDKLASAPISELDSIVPLLHSTLAYNYHTMEPNAVFECFEWVTAYFDHLSPATQARTANRFYATSSLLSNRSTFTLSQPLMKRLKQRLLDRVPNFIHQCTSEELRNLFMSRPIVAPELWPYIDLANRQLRETILADIQARFDPKRRGESEMCQVIESITVALPHVTPDERRELIACIENAGKDFDPAVWGDEAKTVQLYAQLCLVTTLDYAPGNVFAEFLSRLKDRLDALVHRHPDFVEEEVWQMLFCKLGGLVSKMGRLTLDGSSPPVGSLSVGLFSSGNSFASAWYKLIVDLTNVDHVPYSYWVALAAGMWGMVED